MGWSLGWDSRWKRWIGYGVPAYCDHPDCDTEIDRGLGYVCGGEPYGGDTGCGLFFCGRHQTDGYQHCPRCAGDSMAPYDPSPEHPEWTRHMLTDESWAQWRAENPREVERMKAALAACSTRQESATPTATPEREGTQE